MQIRQTEFEIYRIEKRSFRANPEGVPSHPTVPSYPEMCQNRLSYFPFIPRTFPENLVQIRQAELEIYRIEKRSFRANPEGVPSHPTVPSYPKIFQNQLSYFLFIRRTFPENLVQIRPAKLEIYRIENGSTGPF